MRLTRRMEFAASHRLWRSDWDEDRNRAVFGPTASPSSHGHNYELEVTVEGGVDPETGMVMDLKRLKDVMDAEVGARFDHRDLNDDTHYFDRAAPTAENFGRVIFSLLDAALPHELLHRVRLSPREELVAEVSR